MMSPMIFGISAAFGHPNLCGSFELTVLKKDSHTSDEMLHAL